MSTDLLCAQQARTTCTIPSSKQQYSTTMGILRLYYIGHVLCIDICIWYESSQKQKKFWHSVSYQHICKRWWLCVHAVVLVLLHGAYGFTHLCFTVHGSLRCATLSSPCSSDIIVTSAWALCLYDNCTPVKGKTPRRLTQRVQRRYLMCAKLIVAVYVARPPVAYA
jgi:succinate dehydrogenase/fumarate reductase cytochrome b subunit